MNLYLRVLLVFLASFFKPKTREILQSFTLRCRVLPNDLDTNFHMNNGRYATIMDLGRFDMILRNGLMRMMIRSKSVPVLSALQIRYRLPLHAFQPFDLQTRVLCWDEKWVFMEQRFVIATGARAGAVAAIAVVKGGFYDPKRKTTVPTDELLKTMDIRIPSPAFPDYVIEWQRAEDRMRVLTSEAA